MPWRRHVCGLDGAGGGKRVPGDSDWSRPEPAAGHGPGLQVSAELRLIVAYRVSAESVNVTQNSVIRTCGETNS